MSHLLDVARLPEATRLAAADRIRALPDFTLPPLDFFNSAPCPRHATLAEGAAINPPCRRCGVRLHKHQRVGVAWLYTRRRGLVADVMGLGKTATSAGLLAACKQSGELARHKAVIVVRPAVIRQWCAELARFVPRLRTVAATGTRKQRIATYLSGFDILVTGFPVLNNDQELLDRLPLGILVIDDIDPLRNPNTTTAYTIKRLARRCERVVVNTATPIQKRLLELHSVAEVVGGLEIFGSASKFRRDYVREEQVRIYNPSAGRMVKTRKTVGYKNLDDFITKLRPLTLRRTPDDIDDVEYPALAPPHNVWLDLHPAQKARYDTLRAGVLKIIKAEGAQVKRPDAAAKFLYGAQICAGLSTIGDPDGPGTSVKLDWIMNALDGDLAAEKVVIFCQFTNTLASLAARLDTTGIGHVKIWGREADKDSRAAATARFWEDPTCRVLLGTAAIEQGFNLQVARHLINVDQILNPARMTQLAGRIRRDGSSHRTVFVHNLLTSGTQEEGYLDVLEREQALTDHVWGEQSELFEALHPLALLQLVGYSRRLT